MFCAERFPPWCPWKLSVIAEWNNSPPADGQLSIPAFYPKPSISSGFCQRLSDASLRAGSAVTSKAFSEETEESSREPVSDLGVPPPHIRESGLFAVVGCCLYSLWGRFVLVLICEFFIMISCLDLCSVERTNIFLGKKCSFFSCTFLKNRIFLPRLRGHTFICKWHKALLFLDFYQKTHSNRKQNGFLSNWKELILLCNLSCDAGHYQKWMLSLEQHIFLSMSWRQRWSVNQSGADLPAEQTWTISCAIKRIINGCCYLHVIIEGLHVCSDKKLNLKIKLGISLDSSSS